MPVLMGNPDFDMEIGEGDDPAARPGGSRQGFGENLRSGDWKGAHFERLPGTQKELEVVSSLLGRTNVKLYTDRSARKQTLMGVESPKVLHLATHGFSLGDQASDLFFAGISSEGGPASPARSGRVPDLENPLLRSGLALAGANRDDPGEGRSYGIVTAEEVLSLRLRGTEMVVLSACETGVGKIVTGEGVFGLSRAFTQAGAKSLIMSLWPVPDQETSELMSRFYEVMIAQKGSRADALRTAVLQQLQTTKARYGSAHPLYWGGFVFLGEP
jgi:CHAT domain-containing protein